MGAPVDDRAMHDGNLNHGGHELSERPPSKTRRTDLEGVTADAWSRMGASWDAAPPRASSRWSILHLQRRRYGFRVRELWSRTETRRRGRGRGGGRNGRYGGRGSRARSMHSPSHLAPGEAVVVHAVQASAAMRTTAARCTRMRDARHASRSDSSCRGSGWVHVYRYIPGAIPGPRAR